MKKIAIILLTLVLTLVMAVPVMAQTDVDLEILEPTIDVTAPSGFTLVSVVQGGTSVVTGSADGEVESDSPQGYTVTMSRNWTYMAQAGGSPYLVNPFYANVNGGSWVGTAAATTVLDSDVPTIGWEDFTLNVSQEIVPTDPTGSYSITITFAGTVK